MKIYTQRALAIATVLVLSTPEAFAKNPPSRGSARSSVSNNRGSNNNVNRNTNVNQNKNVNVNRDRNVNVDVDVDHHYHGGGYYGGGYYGGGYYGGGCCYNSVGGAVAVAAAVTATSMVTAAVIGSMVTTLPPSCTVVMMNGITYQQCGSAWYQPQFVGGNTSYVVVAAPR